MIAFELLTWVGIGLVLAFLDFGFGRKGETDGAVFIVGVGGAGIGGTLAKLATHTPVLYGEVGGFSVASAVVAGLCSLGFLVAFEVFKRMGTRVHA